MLIPAATPLAAGVIPRTRSGHVILFRRTFDPGGGLWAFPGGYVEAGERPADALERETLEELGMRVRLVLQLVSEGYEDPEAGPAYWRPGDAAALVVFTALALEEPRESDEACEVGVFLPIGSHGKSLRSGRRIERSAMHWPIPGRPTAEGWLDGAAVVGVAIRRERDSEAGPARLRGSWRAQVCEELPAPGLPCCRAALGRLAAERHPGPALDLRQPEPDQPGPELVEGQPPITHPDLDRPFRHTEQTGDVALAHERIAAGQVRDVRQGSLPSCRCAHVTASRRAV
ncbi:MAG: NUDIX domain-containing protein [Solirubrobacteraceae bacterium]